REITRQILSGSLPSTLDIGRIFFFPPIVGLCRLPLGPHPPLLLARRPNRGHIGGWGWTPSCGSYVRRRVRSSRAIKQPTDGQTNIYIQVYCMSYIPVSEYRRTAVVPFPPIQ
ncbi:unnamed protein product, partial [Ectocarpus sp. 12 AP-2014]